MLFKKKEEPKPDQDQVDGLSGIIISTDLEDYNFSEDDKSELGIEVSSDDDGEDTEDSCEEHFSMMMDQSSITGNDNCYVENETKMSFSADSDYQDAYCKDCYDTDNYYAVKFMQDKFHEILKDMIRHNLNLQYLCAYDMSLIGEGHSILYLKEKEPYVIQYIFPDGQIFIAKESGLSAKFCTIAEIRPNDKLLKDFLKEDVINVYESLNKKLNDNNSNSIEFFFVFCEYFKIDEKQLYQMLPECYQNKLEVELKHRIDE